MKIPMVDMLAGYPEIKDEVETAVKNVFNKANFILGEEVKKFEEEFASFNGAKYAVGVANGTDALRLSIIACGIKKGDEIITTPFTFIATSETISQAGAIPVFADINPDTYNLDPEDVQRKITPKTKAILPVHLYGYPAEMDKIMELARKHNLKVIEDCAQSFTAKYKFNQNDWKHTGTMGDCGTFSFFPAKNLGAFGDGGMIITNDKNIYKELIALRNHGSKARYIHDMEGFNSRLDTVQAAILSIKLKHIDAWTEKRNKVAEKYALALKDIAKIPAINENCKHSFNYYTIQFNDKETRDKVQKHLSDNGIANNIYYPIALHRQKAYAHLNTKSLPIAEQVQDTVFSLPMYPELPDEHIKTITDSIKDCVHELTAKK
ncbi:MAG: DegT/DnrJ/EryC1/StrS family aminotransferase [Elusimicrobiales bacterium]|nr:DegT/DnrJ/EryC1/StrS family aminotransferase [Elusimicrobiales bacterium]